MSKQPEKSANRDFFVRFWGVRGTVPTVDAKTVRYGGNTSCLEVNCDGRRLIFDAGTGIRYLGQEMCASGAAIDTDIFLSHTHYDHICGIPFFGPFFGANNRFRIWAGHLGTDLTVKKIMSGLMIAPFFPVPPEIFSAKLAYKDFHAGDVLQPHDDITVRTAVLNHPNGACGYRVEFDGRSICYVTDTEHVPGQLDQNILNLIRDADILIYDSTYTDEEYGAHIGWGHSTWMEGVKLCQAGNVSTFVVFHHDPDHDDDFMDKVAEDVEAVRPGSVVAYEGLVLRPEKR